MKGMIFVASLLLLSMNVSGHEVVEDNGCIDFAEPDESSERDEWYLVNTCLYTVDVLWCSLDGSSDGLECGGEEYYARLDILDSEGRVASDVLFSQDLALGVAACRNDYDPTGFNGLDVDSLLPDGSFTCLIGQRSFGASSLVGASSAVSGVDVPNDSHCVSARIARPGSQASWHLVNDCSYSVDVRWCDASECGGSSFYRYSALIDPSAVVDIYTGFDGNENMLLAACREEIEQGFYGFDRDSFQSDGAFACLTD